MFLYRLLAYLESAVGGVVLEHVNHVVQVNEWIVDSNNVDIARSSSNASDKATNATETVNTNVNHFY